MGHRRDRRALDPARRVARPGAVAASRRRRRGGDHGLRADWPRHGVVGSGTAFDRPCPRRDDLARGALRGGRRCLPPDRPRTRACSASPGADAAHPLDGGRGRRRASLHPRPLTSAGVRHTARVRGAAGARRRDPQLRKPPLPGHPARRAVASDGGVPPEDARALLGRGVAGVGWCPRTRGLRPRARAGEDDPHRAGGADRRSLGGLRDGLGQDLAPASPLGRA